MAKSKGKEATSKRRKDSFKSSGCILLFFLLFFFSFLLLQLSLVSMKVKYFAYITYKILLFLRNIMWKRVSMMKT